MNFGMDTMQMIVFGVIILGILTYSWVIFMAPLSDAYIKLLQKYHPEWFKPMDTAPQTTIVYNGSAPVDWVKPKGVSDHIYLVLGGGL
jgi:hypothetical protein